MFERCFGYISYEFVSVVIKKRPNFYVNSKKHKDTKLFIPDQNYREKLKVFLETKGPQKADMLLMPSTTDNTAALIEIVFDNSEFLDMSFRDNYIVREAI